MRCPGLPCGICLPIGFGIEVGGAFLLSPLGMVIMGFCLWGGTPYSGGFNTADCISRCRLAEKWRDVVWIQTSKRGEEEQVGPAVRRPCAHPTGSCFAGGILLHRRGIGVGFGTMRLADGV